MSRNRTYSDLRRLETFEERYHYLSLGGIVGAISFGSDRWINQRFYTSREWKQVRSHVILRDHGCDLGVLGYEIFTDLYVHHMNPVTPSDIQSGAVGILDPEFLITTSLQTHNAIHYGDETLLPGVFADRRPGDTKLW